MSSRAAGPSRSSSATTSLATSSGGAEQPARADGRELDLDAALVAAVLGDRVALVQAGDERREPAAARGRVGHLDEVERRGEVEDQRDAAVGRLAPPERPDGVLDVAAVGAADHPRQGRVRGAEPHRPGELVLRVVRDGGVVGRHGLQCANLRLGTGADRD